MTRSTFLRCAFVLAGACFASAASPQRPTSGGGLGPQVTCAATDFQKKVSYLTIPFSPGPGITPPATSSSSPDGHDYAVDLGHVFDAASPSPDFQNALCTLDAVYINAVPCPTRTECFQNSWGWRQSVPTTPNGRIVALSIGLWDENKYTKYETDLTRSILPPSGSGVSYSCSSSDSYCKSIDNLTTALLAALAHEVGHIAWYVEVSSVLGPDYFCNQDFFGTSWYWGVQRPPVWRALSTPTQRSTLDEWRNIHKKLPHISQIDNPGSGDDPKQFIYELLDKSQPWASLFAAVSPDEDFVETYKFEVLMTAYPNLTSVKIKVPSVGDADIVGDYRAGSKQDLNTKVGCVSLSF
jgi:hypothetical protein